MPEPWWGWTPEEGRLYTVTVNLSPGPGGMLQSRRCIECAKIGVEKSYSHVMRGETLRRHLEQTEKWHLTHRHLPIMRAMGVKERNLPEDTRHHLSLELNPYHQPKDDSKDKNCDLYSNYYRLHKSDIFFHILVFAAKAASMITVPDGEHAGCSLRNIVIVRASIKNIIRYTAGQIKLNEVKIDLPDESADPGKQCKPVTVKTFRLTPQTQTKDQFDISRCLFICVTGPRNNLPAAERLKEIIRQSKESFDFE